MSIRPVFRHADGVLPNLLAIGWALGAWGGGVALICRGGVAASAAGTLLLAHAMVIAGYLMHEFAHNTVFRSNAVNEAAGRVASWLAGSCYAPYAELRAKHMRHHVDRADVVGFDYRAFLQRHPRLGGAVVALEWAHVPAVDLLMHAAVLVLPFRDPRRADGRARVVAVLGVRMAAFAALAAVRPWAPLLYAAAYLLTLTVLRFADAYQHTYDAYALLPGEAPPDDTVRDRAYEQRNTYSNLVSVEHPWLNLLLLNFSYHNAHHARPAEPWHRLPALHARLDLGDGRSPVLPMAALLGPYHRHRVARVMADDYGVVGHGPAAADGFVGAVGVSFLTAV